ncbi:MAG: endonuclease III [Muribaculaceae bacterium]|nr:endonuclease III [Muribaculaceae bacterium]
MTLKQRYDGILAYFAQAMPIAQTELHYDTPFHLLLAVILSAQCTDKRVNIITPALFAAYPDAEALAAATPEQVFEYVKSVSYPNQKSKKLVEAARMIVDEFGGEIPSDMDNLLKLPGVGRKTANVMLSVVFGQPAMPVDTHVYRVSERIGLTTDSPSPLHTEKELTSHIPPQQLGIAHHWLILHGRYVCKARRPDCLDCGIRPYCRHYQTGLKSQAKAKK